MSLADGTYHIINQQTEGYAALLNTHDTSDMVTVFPAQLDQHEGYEVST